MLKSTLSGKTVTYTALCLIPPNEIWPQIQNIRSMWDPAYNRWMPHINLAFPFIPPAEFELGQQLLQDELAEFPAFKINFKELGFFSNKKKAILWVNPEVNDDQLNKLEQSIVKVFPFCTDQLKKSPDGFHPHLTLGNFTTAEVNEKKNQFQKTWVPSEIVMDKVSLIKRNGQEAPFAVINTVTLKQS